MPRILSVGTAVPPHRFSQEEIQESCGEDFAEAFERGRGSLFANSGVAHRHLVERRPYYFRRESFEARNRAYFEHAMALSTSALASCLDRAGMTHRDVDHIVSVTTTGLLTPSLEAHLAQALPFRRTVKRTPLFGAGCAGGAVALARAQEYLRGHPSETAVVLSTELCSLTFLPSEGTMTQLVAAALFGDGAAAVLLCGDEHPAAGRAKVEVLDSGSALIPDSLDIMGWDFGAHGMRLVLSPRAPELIEQECRAAVEPFLRKAGLELSVVGSFLLHPGSVRILDALERALGLSPLDTDLSRVFLSRYGNLSSASVLFILGAALEAGPPARPHALLAALGPGFACELTLLRWL
jgi:alkylresorcinol/alkylpyrone synthase